MQQAGRAVRRRSVPWAGWLLAALVVPAVLHPLGLGPALLPMHIPVFLAGATLGPLAGMSVGIVAPWISHLLTGMPPLVPPIAPLMVLELMAYGGVAGALRQYVTREKRGFLVSYVWLIPSLVAGRLVLAAAAALIGPALGLSVPPGGYVWNALITGLPGIALQLLLVPLIFRAVDPRLASYREDGSSRREG